MLTFLRARTADLARPRLLAVLFVLCALPAGLFHALGTPPGSVPDEPQHIARAEGLRLGQVLGSAPTGPSAVGAPQAGVMMSVAMFNVAISNLGLPLAAAAQSQGWTDQEVFCPTQMTEYFPVLYLPGVLGLQTGKTLGLSPWHSFYLARVFMLLAFIGLGATAIALAGWGNALLFALLTLPTTIVLASSLSQDGLLIAAATLAAAALTRARRGLAAVLIGAVGLAKAPYAALALACLPPGAAPGWSRRALLVMAAALPPALWLWTVLHGPGFPWPVPPYHPGPLWPGSRDIWLTQTSATYNLLVLRAHPLAALWLPLAALGQCGPRLWHEMLMGVFMLPVWLSAPAGGAALPAWEYPALTASVLAALADTALRPGAAGWRAADGALVVAALFAAYAVIALSMYLIVNPAGADVIHAIQGRYLLPLFPFLLFLPGCLPRPPGAARLPACLFVLPAVAMAIVNLYAVPSLVAHLYALPGP